MLWINGRSAGLLPAIFRGEDPRDPVEQANDRYAHGGGWSEEWTKGAVERGEFTLHEQSRQGLARLEFFTTEMGVGCEDPEIYHEVSRGIMRDWNIILFEGEWVALVQDGVEGFRLARMD